MVHKRIPTPATVSFLCILTMVLSLPALAQQAPKPKPAPPAFMRAPALVSPEIHPDNKVTFRLSAPKAGEVTVSGEWMEGFGASEKMNKDEEGIWSLTVGPLAPELYGYTFNVDEQTENQLKKLKAGNKLYWVACGVDDSLAYASSRNLVAVLEKLGIKHTFRESGGGHTWANWRIYLSEIAPLLFK